MGFSGNYLIKFLLTTLIEVELTDFISAFKVIFLDVLVALHIYEHFVSQLVESGCFSFQMSQLFLKRFSTISCVDFEPTFKTEENLFSSHTWVIAVVAIGGLAFLKIIQYWKTVLTV